MEAGEGIFLLNKMRLSLVFNMEYQKKGGLKWESFKFTDYSYEKVYGSAPQEPIIPLKRDISGIPGIFQGGENTCVSCSITWIRQYLDLQKPALAWQWLAKISQTTSEGAAPSKVLEPARKIGILDQEHWQKLLPVDKDHATFFSHESFREITAKYRIGSYFFLHKLDKQSLFHALKQGPIAIGVDDWGGVGPHMMVAYDVTDDGSGLKCINWWNPSEQDQAIVPFEKIELAISFGELPVTIDTNNIRLSMLTVLRDKLDFLPWKKILVGILVAVSAFLGFTTKDNGGEKVLGASSVASGYRSAVSSSMTASQTTLPVSSVTLTSAETLTTTTLRLGESVPVYLKINPGGATEELVECYGLSSLTFTQCGRGIGYTGTGTTSTISARQFPHAAGETVILSNDAPFFNRFLDTYTSQSVTGTKTFSAGRIDIGDNTSGSSKFIYFQVGQTAEPYIKVTKGSTSSTFYFAPDGTSEFQFNASGTTVGASSTKGVFLTDGLLGVNASSTGGIAFNAAGLALVNVSTTASTNGGFLKYTFNAANQLYWDVASFLAGAWTWTGNQIFSGNVTSTGILAVQTPTSTQDAANKGYVDSTIAQGYATGTAGETISIGQGLYIQSTSSQLFRTLGTGNTSTFAFVGIAQSAATVGTTVSFTRAGGTATGLSALTPGSYYYITDTAGTLGTTPGTRFAKVGQAMSTTTMRVIEPKFVMRGSTTFTGTGTNTITTGFYPGRIRLLTTNDGANKGISIGDDTNISIGYDPEADAPGIPDGFRNGSKAFAIAASGVGPRSTGTIGNKTVSGFDIVCDVFGIGGTSTIDWEAESL